MVARRSSQMNLKPRSYVNFKYKLDDQLIIGIKILLVIWGLTLLADWSWKIILPSPPAVPIEQKVAKDDLTNTIIESHWFGNNGAHTSSATINFKLMGVFMPTSAKGGFAILKMSDGKQRVVFLKEEIVPGIKFQSLGVNYIEVDQAGNSKKIFLENRMSFKASSNSNQLKTP